RFIPKGSTIAEYSIEDILKIRGWINNYPRRVLNGKSFREVVEECENCKKPFPPLGEGIYKV
ncbi:MAG: hypothetical protein FWJ59_07080, partial [Caldicoprobacter sp.]